MDSYSKWRCCQALVVFLSILSPLSQPTLGSEKYTLGVDRKAAFVAALHTSCAGAACAGHMCWPQLLLSQGWISAAQLLLHT